MKNKIFNLILFLSCTIGFAQQTVTWEDLSKVEFTDKYFPIYEEYFMYPEFSDTVKALDGKQVTITGYFLNISPEDDLYILSKGPMSACFFCGQGGPETAVEVHFETQQDFKTDTVVAITGTLALNQNDVEHFIYILSDCKGKLVN